MAEPTGPERKRRLGDFEIVREVGRGGMAIVHETRQISVNRKVALKVLASTRRLMSDVAESRDKAVRLLPTKEAAIRAEDQADSARYRDVLSGETEVAGPGEPKAKVPL